MRLLEFLATLVLFVFLFSQSVLAMTSANYEINWDSINVGGMDTATSNNYSLLDTLGEIATGISSSGSYKLQYAGYRQSQSEPMILSFLVQAQDDTSQVSCTNFNEGGLQVTVADASGFSADDHIVTVQDIGQAQKISIGQVEGKAGNVVTVDNWEGDAGLACDGVNDHVYKLSGHLADLGTLSTSSVKTAVSFFEVTTNASGGYTVYVNEDHNLQVSAGRDIDDVSDGTVSSGSEEYGIESVGQDAQGVGDVAISDSNQVVATDPSYAAERRTGVIHKAAIDGSSPAGHYNHTVSYYCIASF